MNILLTFLVALTIVLPIEKKKLDNNQHVNVEMKFPVKISIGKTSELAFFFKPIDGIHVNTTPMFELRLDKNSSFDVVGNPRFQKDKNDYLDITKPIEFSVKAKDNLKIGQYDLKGKLNYFYCSDAEGWCNRFTQPIDVIIEVTK